MAPAALSYSMDPQVQNEYEQSYWQAQADFGDEPFTDMDW